MTVAYTYYYSGGPCKCSHMCVRAVVVRVPEAALSCPTARHDMEACHSCLFSLGIGTSGHVVDCVSSELRSCVKVEVAVLGSRP